MPLLGHRPIEMSICESQCQNDLTGGAASAPTRLLTLVFLAYARGSIAARKIEPACRAPSTFMALAWGLVPDPRTMAACGSSRNADIPALCRERLRSWAAQAGGGGPPFACDGVTRSSHAAQAWSGPFGA
jgi:hypothetical protein